MVHTAAVKGNTASAQRQRRKTGKYQHDTTEREGAVTSDSYPVGQLEPRVDAQQIASQRLSIDVPAQCTATGIQPQPGNAVSMAESSIIPCHLADSQSATAPLVQSLALQPTVSLSAPSTGWLSDSVKVADRVASLLNSFDALQVAQELQKLGYPELVGQRACLEVHLVNQRVDVDSCVNWINQQTNLASLNR